MLKGKNMDEIKGKIPLKYFSDGSFFKHAMKTELRNVRVSTSSKHLHFVNNEMFSIFRLLKSIH